MSLRSKIVILLSAVVLAYAGLDHLMQRVFVYHSFVQLESATTQKDLQRVDEAFANEAQALARDCEDLAKLDSFERSLVEQDPSRFEAALSSEGLDRESIHVVCVCDTRGVVKHSYVVDPRSRSGLAKLEGFGVGDSLVERALISAASRPVEGLMSTERAPLIVASHPVSDVNEDTRRKVEIGTLVIGRFVTTELVAEMSQRTGVPFEIWTREDAKVPDDVRSTLAHVTEPTADVLVEDPEDGDRLNAYWVRADVRNKPALFLRARFERPITAKGNVAVRYALVSTIAAGVLLMLVLLNMVQRTVLEPLGQLTEHAVSIAKSEDFSKRIRSDREDEVGILAREFDGMISRVAESRAALVETARAAGMSEIATGVLHNVGNVLNSVNVSARIAVEQAKGTASNDLSRVVNTLRPSAADLSTFLRDDPRGKHLFPLLDSLTDKLVNERTVLVRELEALTEGIEHIKELIQSQQGYAGRAGVREVVSLAEQVETAISITNQATSASTAIQIVREFDEIEPVSVDRHRLVEILVNLIQNARQSVTEAGSSPMRVTIRIRKLTLQRVRLEVEDNGVGIAPENLARVFTHGFTTKKNGHGFGLHASANAATEMGGNLSATSEGKGQGATFVLELPLKVPATARATS